MKASITRCTLHIQLRLKKTLVLLRHSVPVTKKSEGIVFSNTSYTYSFRQVRVTVTLRISETDV
jgi:hypothetical protein